MVNWSGINVIFRITVILRILSNELPNRHRNHEIEKLSERHFNSLFPVEWVSHVPKVDYGTDMICEIVKDRGVTGLTFSVQLKGKEREQNQQYVTASIKRSTINRWLNKLEPVLLVSHVVDENESYWKWIENNTVDLTKDNKSYSISIPRDNKLSKLDWKSIENYVSEIFSMRYLIHGFPTIEKSNEKAWELFFERDFETALPLFKEIVAKNSAPQIWDAIAICEFQLFNYQKALISINKALENNEDSKILLFTKSGILIEQGSLEKNKSKMESGIDILKRLLKENFIHESIYYNYGSALLKLGKYEDSIPIFKKALLLNPNKPELWNNLGFAYMTQGANDLEMKCYDNALTLNPDLSETLFTKGSALYRNYGKIDEGLELMLKAAEKSKRHEIDFPYMFFWIAAAYGEKGNLIEAFKWNKKGLDLFPTDEYLLEQSDRIKNAQNS